MSVGIIPFRLIPKKIEARLRREYSVSPLCGCEWEDKCL